MQVWTLASLAYNIYLVEMSYAKFGKDILITVFNVRFQFHPTTRIHSFHSNQFFFAGIS
jgi:hypothetical protein